MHNSSSNAMDNPARGKAARNSRGLSLRGKLVALMLIGTTLVGAITLGSATWWDAQLVEHQRLESTHALARAFHQDFERILWLQNPDDAADTVTRLQSFDFIESATLYNDLDQPQFRYLRRSDDDLDNSRQRDEPDSATVAFSLPLLSGDSEIGRVDFTISDAPFREAANELFGRAVQLAPAIIVLAVVISALALTLLNGPILEFTRRISALRTHPHQDGRLPEDQPGEVGQMYNSVNALLDTIQRSDQALLNQRRALEEGALVMALKLDGRLSAHNPALEQLTAGAVEHWHEQPLQEVLEEESAAMLDNWLDTSKGRAGQLSRGVLVLRPIEGSPWGEYPLSLTCALIPVTCQKGKTRSFQLIGFDITEQKQLEDQLRSARRAALQAAEAKAQFLANMSHEIRTPMNGVMGMCELLLDENLNDTQAGYAQTIQRSADSLLHIINDILDISKIEANRLSLEKTDFDPQLELNDVCQLIQPMAEAKGLVFHFETTTRLPGKVIGDPVRLRQVLINLLGNAVKFTESGSVTLRVAHQRQQGRSLIRFEIEDTGIGLDEDAQQRIFERFEQADTSTTRRHGGTGLGLAISQALVQLMGGDIEVSSEPAKGSRFFFEIRFEAATPTPLGEVSEFPGLDGVRPGIRVLVAEDEVVNRQVARGMLNKLKCDITLAEDGEQALAAVEEGEFDIIFMDCQMPVMDGLSATAHIRERDDDKAKTPILALTANASKEDEATCLAAGMDGFVSKPVKIGVLAEALSRYIT